MLQEINRRIEIKRKIELLQICNGDVTEASIAYDWIYPTEVRV